MYGCSPDPTFYVDKPPDSPGFARDRLALFVRENPFGSLPGYETNLGVAAVPTIPVGGYVYSTDGKKWVLHATQGGTGRGDPACSSASGG